MQLKDYYFLSQILILCILCLHSDALYGQDIQQVRRGEYTFIVSISQKIVHRRTFSYCTGGLVTRRDVVTAEHCLAGKDQRLIRVVAGSNDLRLGSIYHIKWWTSYAPWARENNIPLQFSENDVAVIRLQKNVTNEIILLPLPSNYITTLYDTYVQVGGWGMNSQNQFPLIMEKINVSVISQQHCERRTSFAIGETINFDPNVFCTIGEPLALVQQGDSGAPVIHSDTFVGLTSGSCPFPNVNVHPLKVNVHYDLMYYKRFILYVTNFL